ncbi:amino acid permease 6-like [Coffea eugenioides]|uniref:amino acid permease 6-like n=1 Tax=Coffea eugenioides TaxID=49369 RepID=UPI000F612D9B|nr:amino acid permease 6-like [Coffea eugenioides]
MVTNMVGDCSWPAFLAEHPADSTNGTDDDGRPKRTGTFYTASAHIITTVVGSGVLSLPWAISQLGWIAGPMALISFSLITLFASTILADFYRSPDPVSGRRNYTYMDVVKVNLGGRYNKLSGIAQYGNLVGFTTGYIITSANSMVAIKRSYCFHKHGHSFGCHTTINPFIIIFGVIQIPNIQELSMLSLHTTVMCCCHAFIGLGLSVAKVAGGRPHVKTSLTEVFIDGDKSNTNNLWTTFTALGNLAFAYGFSDVLIEIQDTLGSSKPENRVMKQASLAGISISTLFYMSCGLLGYAAFGDKAPGNILAGFGFFEPFWLIDLANIFVVIHLMGAYQICGQPVFGFMESSTRHRWPNTGLVNHEYAINVPGYGVYRFTLFRMIWRTTYVIITTVIAMMFPFFNDIVGLIGALSFWPLTVYFPIKMRIEKEKIPIFSFKWVWMQTLSMCCLLTSIAATVGSVGGVVKFLQTFKLFKSID